MLRWEARFSGRQYNVRMFKAYFDRSELGSPADVVAVSGYLGAEEHWNEFQPAWSRVLSEFGVEVFHMVEFENRLGAFTNWDQDRRTALLGQLIDLIANHAFVAIGAAMVLDDYNALSNEDKTLLGHPYALCGVKAVADTFRWIDARLESAAATGKWSVTERENAARVEFVFEQGDEGAGELESQLQREQQTGVVAGRIVNVTFGDKQIAALQAADFAAYETTKQLVRTIGAEERAMRRSLDALTDRVEYVAEYFDRRTMRENLERIRRDAHE